MESLKSIHESKTGKVSDKWTSYLEFYNRAFAHLHADPIRMLEIGVQNGGSLETWAAFFKNGKKFVGCDINPKCGDLTYSDSRISVIVGDANSEDAYKKIVAASDQFDLIIDDGSHHSNDIFAAFVNYFSLLKPGGLFVVEDAHSLFMNAYGGGLLKSQSAQRFFHLLADFVSVEFWSKDISLEAYFCDFFPSGQVPKFILDGWVDSVQFRNSIIVIERALSPTHNKLGMRSVVGTEALVEPAVVKMTPDSQQF